MTTVYCCPRCGSTEEPVVMTVPEKPAPKPYKGYMGPPKSYLRPFIPTRKPRVNEIIAAAKRFEKSGSQWDLDNARELRRIAAERMKK